MGVSRCFREVHTRCNCSGPCRVNSVSNRAASPNRNRSPSPNRPPSSRARRRTTRKSLSARRKTLNVKLRRNKRLVVSKTKVRSRAPRQRRAGPHERSGDGRPHPGLTRATKVAHHLCAAATGSLSRGSRDPEPSGPRRTNVRRRSRRELRRSQDTAPASRRADRQG